jgi:type IV secretion system protein VirB9
MVRFFTKFFLVFFLLASSALAAQLPRYLGSEKKFRSYIYNPNDVYRYIGHYTYQGFVEFAEGETISTISMGDPTLWLFESLGNRLFLKPVGEDGSETNMTIITNKKVYHFELLAREAKGITDPDLIFVVKFVYPDEKNKNIVQFPKFPVSDEPDLRDLTGYSFNYQYTGENSIAPLRVFDNGEFTYFQFSKKNAEIPAIFTVDADGFEALINFRAAGSYIIVERVSPQFTLRNGNDIVCVYNMDLYASGRAAQSTLMRREDGTLNTRRFSSAESEQPQANASVPSPYPTTQAQPQASAPSDPNMVMPPMTDLPPGFPAELLPPGAAGGRSSRMRLPGTFF